MAVRKDFDDGDDDDIDEEDDVEIDVIVITASIFTSRDCSE